jgi:hypothetical protein
MAEVEDYWPPERAIVEEEYPHIAMPFADLPAREFSMTGEWTADNVLDYMRTWSATLRYVAANDRNPVDMYEDDVKSIWGAGRRPVRWPIILRVGRKRGE